MPKKLYKSKVNVRVDGICAGVGEYLGIDATLVRLVGFVMIVMSGFLPGLFVYLAAAFIIPRQP